ncbi:MAG TPA: DUF4352 domain-containing protein [Cellulomonas sp.]
MSEQHPYQPAAPIPGPTPGSAPGPVPGYAPAPAPVPPRRSWFARHKVLTALGVLVVIGIGSAALGGGGDGGSSTAGAASDADADADASAGTTAEDVTPGIGATVADGSFEFVVTQVETGIARVGDQLLGQDAQGQFVLVHVTVTNVGTEAQYFYQGAQTASDTQGRTHSADSSAAIYLDEGTLLLDQINPGNQVEGVIVFDVPADATLASVELHDSLLSGGVTVALG